MAALFLLSSFFECRLFLHNTTAANVTGYYLLLLLAGTKMQCSPVQQKTVVVTAQSPSLIVMVLRRPLQSCYVLLFSVSDTVRKLPTSSGDYRRKKTAVVVEKRRPVSSMVMSALIITTTAAADAAAVGDCGKSPRELVQLSSSSSLTAAGAR